MSYSALSVDLAAPSPNAALQERLARVQATLEEARLRVVESLDHELASVRGWLQALQTFDPTLTMETPANADEPTPQQDSQASKLMESDPQESKREVVAFNKGDFKTERSAIPEPQVDPELEQATIEELNAALQEAFRDMEE